MLQLVIGNKNYSTWSLRPWLLMSHFDVAFEEIMESLGPEQLSERLGQYSASNKVPVLLDGDVCVWDSLAICEYINEQHLEGKGWPVNVENRARARSISAQMHSGFGAMRSEMPMNIRAKRKLVLSDEALGDIEAVQALWQQSIEASGGPWLCGEFSIADCMFAPVVMRFMTYTIKLTPAAQTYAQQLLALPAIKQWINDALVETEVVPADEAGIDC